MIPLFLLLSIACSSKETTDLSHMTKIPAGKTILGARNVPSVSGFQKDNVKGQTLHPNHTGKRAPGAPPLLAPKQGFTPPPSLSQKNVFVSSFWIDQTEVTRAEYKKFLDATGYKPPFVSEEWAKTDWNWNRTNYPKGTGAHPVVLVSWYDAQEYCRWKGKRLPTEAEWQLAALGDASEGNHYPWGKEYNANVLNHGQIDAPNFDDSDGFLYTSPVGSFPEGASPYGLLDMFGNAWEYTSDARTANWSDYQFSDSKQNQNPTANLPSLYIAVRGGSYFFDFRPFPGGERHSFLTEIRRKTSGFRCAK